MQEQTVDEPPDASTLEQTMNEPHDTSTLRGTITGRGQLLLACLLVMTVLVAVVSPSGRIGWPSLAVAQDASVDPVSVVQRVDPMVVTILNEQRETDEQLSDADELLPASKEIAGAGSGFFIDEQGHIVTNQHVVADGDQFDVILADGTSRPATLVGADPISDLAVLQIDGPEPAVAILGDSSALQPGQPVLAIGSPLGAFTNTVTGGIVSAIGRTLPEDVINAELQLTGMIQHDASINPGSSGGPLVNMAGEVVGVNSYTITEIGTSSDSSKKDNKKDTSMATQGLFVAIPTNTVQRVTAELIASGRIVYASLGLSLSVELTPGVARFFGLPVDYGVYVGEVESGGPADRSGIREDDIIVAIDGTRFGEGTLLTDILLAYHPGDIVPVTVQRDGGERTFPLILGTASVA